ncbi:FeoA family protein [Paenibacillus terrigena]|uniref:FeoA family protein n=1 Tax=Paenibacillus terrigena TaxID=369333 RepID=UPI0028D53EA4|nr:FeoA family protein [Paenibacillus terrigena]
MNSQAILNLASVAPGSTVRIHSCTALHTLVARRLLDLGITVGSEVHLKRKAPFGGPITCESNGQMFGIRRQEAKKIEVILR